GRDADLRAQAATLTAGFLTDPHAVLDATAQIALPIAALDGDAALHRNLLAALTRADNPHDRAAALSGLGSFRDPALFERSLQLYLTDDLRPGEFWAIAGHAHDTQALQSVAFVWLTQNFDAVAAKLGDEGVSSLPFVGAGFCSQADRDRVEQFF